MRRFVMLGLLLAGVTLGLYWPLTHFGLVYYDDPLFLTDCPEIQSGLTASSMVWAFTSVILANWHPLTTLSFVVDHQLFGTNPPAEHMVNVLLHTVNVLLLFGLLRKLTGSDGRSALVAAIFAWHPLRVESVGWITERKDVLSGFFFFLTLLAYVDYVAAAPAQPRKSRFYYGLGLVALACGLMSKAMLVTVPFVLLLLDIWPLGRLLPVATGRADGQAATLPAVPSLPARLARLAWEKWPFLVIAVVFSGLTYWVQKNSSAVVSLSHLGWNYRIANAITSYLRYLGKFFYPVDLAVIYPYVRIEDWGQTGLILLGLLGVTALGVWQLRKRPWLAVGWLWYLGMSLPIIGLIQVGESCMADRYTYLTLIGPVVALVWLIPEGWWQPGWRRTAFVAGTAAGLGTLLLLTSSQIQYWRDTVHLFGHAIAVTGSNPGAESGLAMGLEHIGQPDAALEHYRRAEALNPQDAMVFLQSGYLLMKQQRWAEAAADTRQALELQPNDFAGHENLGMILPQLGQTAEGRQHWEAALKINPDAPDLLNNLAWSFAANPDPALRNGPRAVELAEHACALTHYEKVPLLGTLAAAYAEAGRFAEAIATAQKACDRAAAQGQTALGQRNQELLELYQKHQAWHDPATGFGQNH